MIIKITNLLIVFMNLIILILGQLPENYKNNFKDLTNLNIYFIILLTFLLIITKVIYCILKFIFKITNHYNDMSNILIESISFFLALIIGKLIIQIPYIENILKLIKN